MTNLFLGLFLDAWRPKRFHITKREAHLFCAGFDTALAPVFSIQEFFSVRNLSKLSFTARMARIATAAFFLASAGFAQTVPESAYFVMPMEIIHEEKPADPRRMLSDCVNDPACSKGLDGIGSLFGIPPGAIQENLEKLEDTPFTLETRVEGFERIYELDAPDGYSFCRIDAEVRSRGSSRPGEFNLSAKNDWIRVITFVDDPSFPQKARSVHARLFLTIVRDKYYNLAKKQRHCNVTRCWRIGVQCKGSACGDFKPVGRDPVLDQRYGHNQNCPGKVF